MICLPCNTGEHSDCTNPATCPCQHRKTKHMREPDGTTVSSPMSERNALRMIEPADTTTITHKEGCGCEPFGNCNE